MTLAIPNCLITSHPATQVFVTATGHTQADTHRLCSEIILHLLATFDVLIEASHFILDSILYIRYQTV